MLMHEENGPVLPSVRIGLNFTLNAQPFTLFRQGSQIDGGITHGVQS